MSLRHRAIRRVGSLSTRARTVRDLMATQQAGSVKFVNKLDTVTTAAQQMVNNRVTSLAVKDASTRRVVGLLTQGDIVQCLASKMTPEHMTFSPAPSWDVQVGSIMTPTRHVLYLTPEDSVEEAHALIATSGKRHIPVLSGSSLLGVISTMTLLRGLLPDDGGSAKDRFVSTVMGRKGVPRGTELEQPGAELVQRLALHAAVSNLPHPHKGTEGEDAYLLGPTMLGVADGVGSWWEAGIDPSLYARALMAASHAACVQQVERGRELRPRKVLDGAWQALRQSAIVGSSTVCLVGLHPVKPELISASVGDSGFLILRRTPAANGASAGGKYGAAAGGYGVVFRSAQQLHSFNAPYQLGRALDAPDSEADHASPDSRFETPDDAALARFAVAPGDLVILATDGLFDNMAEETILDVITQWDGEGGSKDSQALASQLAQRALELSLDRETDSPFALLAKDNDIMWGGGRPDDITIIACQVLERSASASSGPPTGPPTEAIATGPGEPPDLSPSPEEEPEELRWEWDEGDWHHWD